MANTKQIKLRVYLKDKLQKTFISLQLFMNYTDSNNENWFNELYFYKENNNLRVLNHSILKQVQINASWNSSHNSDE